MRTLAFSSLIQQKNNKEGKRKNKEEEKNMQ
jgi:hypothetical protein